MVPNKEVLLVVAALLAGATGLGERLKDVDVTAVSMQTLGCSTRQIGIAVMEDSRELGYAAEDILAALTADGTLAAIFRSYGLTYRPPEGL